MIEVPLYPDGYPCKCSGNCDYSKAYIDAGKPLFIDYESYIKKGFQPQNEKEKKILNYLTTTYCLNK
jgi:hypothetical protein|tara:strand:- start:469 stop:669 length:201 start_codon:yes stop_codon:yes gene_type:complete